MEKTCIELKFLWSLNIVLDSNLHSFMTPDAFFLPVGIWKRTGVFPQLTFPSTRQSAIRLCLSHVALSEKWWMSWTCSVKPLTEKRIVQKLSNVTAVNQMGNKFLFFFFCLVPWALETQSLNTAAGRVREANHVWVLCSQAVMDHYGFACLWRHTIIWSFSRLQKGGSISQESSWCSLKMFVPNWVWPKSTPVQGLV